MSETTTGGTARTPEFKMASGLLETLRRDLITDAFAYRPLAPVGTAGPLARFLPEGIRRHAMWSRHALVGALAAFIVFVTAATQYSFFDDLGQLTSGLMAAVPVLMTLVRPIAAWWAAVAMTLVLAVGTARRRRFSPTRPGW
ncbi:MULTISPECIES: hypothetical protein [unclassified Streptomyces]|uniref:hypothetical protein n=1 Tax=unclassified Streptomyces TaxID=2593676 RepID=UPI001BE533D7|nr:MULTISPECIES: hypothetical protein [unclassified Streptomyces]MBT2402145.1 hypothetical protein [Streptomyces sp. ISL-21]MBT2609331.1 hypothetical protein [Streptomyces sp. ISL-87]